MSEIIECEMQTRLTREKKEFTSSFSNFAYCWIQLLQSVCNGEIFIGLKNDNILKAYFSLDTVC